MEYDFRKIEKKWQQKWKESKVYKVNNPEHVEGSKPKCYVLDMFPYPSGAGLHVGHPLGYIASDIYSRYKRLKGFNVLHPMGFDSFGLPAEQYALDTGQHPAETTKKNIETFKAQLNNIGFSYDWDREVQTSDPKFYKWTQWIFLQLFNSYYDRKENKAKPIIELIRTFETEGNLEPQTLNIKPFSADEWKKYDEKTQQDILMQYRLAYCGFGEVNWCEALGTVLANDEVINGVSERGGHPVVKKKLRQWYLRITEYADRLLEGLEKVDFSEAMKEMQTNWIGRSSGAEVEFEVGSRESGVSLRVYTTRPDTIFGVDFMVIAPEHELVEKIKSKKQSRAVDEYITYVKSRSERERMAEKKISGVFTGSYALNPFNGREIPIWISEYVLIGYGTGAIMAVPCGDQRDFLFAKHFNIPITNIISKHFNGEEANPTKEAVLENSDFINGMVMKDAIDVVINKIEEMGTLPAGRQVGKRKVNYKMRDAAFSRQRYWGEPFPIVWKDGIAYPLDEKELPLILPEVKSYTPGPDGEGPLANIPEWTAKNLETNTMPGYAGSSWYFLRYMDPDNDKTFCDRKISDYWNQVDIYIGGTEHAVGHLLYSRMWTKFLYDLGLIGFDEPYKRLVNQGMITGVSQFVHQYLLSAGPVTDDIGDYLEPKYFPYVFISKSWADDLHEGNLSKERQIIIEKEIEKIKTDLNKKHPNKKVSLQNTLKVGAVRVNIMYVNNNVLNIEEFKGSSNEFKDSIIIKDEDGEIKCSWEVEKMSKSKHNVVNPNDIIAKYGADTFRMYEMFLGPVEMSKPWDTKGIEGVHRFLKKFWRLFFDETKGTANTFSPLGMEPKAVTKSVWDDEKPTNEELKVLHKTIKKIEEDTERFSFNTAVSAFMIATNELTDLKCHKKEILEPLLILLAPYAPHIAEELYAQLRQVSPLRATEQSESWEQSSLEGASILNATFPKWNEKYLKETSKAYPVAINGKTRTELTLALDATQQQVEELVLKDATVIKWLEGKQPKKIIYVKNKMINVVV